MSDPSPSGETARWFCTMPRNLGRCFGPNTAPGHHACGPTWDCPTCDGEGCEEGCGRRGGCDDAYSGPDSHKTCRSCRGWGRSETEPPPPVLSSDTPSDERDEVCGSMGPRIGDEPERPRCAQPLDHDGQHRGFPGSGFESVQWGAPIMRDEDFARTYRPDPPPTPVDGDSGEALRFTAEVQGERMVYVLVTDHGDSGETYSAGPFTDVLAAPRPDVAAALAAQINRSSPPVGEERRPVDVTALPEWEAFVKRHQHYGGLGLGQHGECADCSLIEAVAAADRGDRA